MQHLDEGLLQAWLDRDRSGLSAVELAEIGRHLASCETCARELEALQDSSRQVEALLAGPAGVEESIPAYTDIRARAQEGGTRARRRPAWVTAGWAASIAVALGAGWFANEMYRAERLPPSVAESAGDAGARAAAASAPPTAAAGESALDSAPVRMARERAEPAASAPERFAGAPPAPAPAADSVVTRATTFDDARPVTVTGKVTDESGRPLEAAQVIVQGLDVGTLTRADGSFELLFDPRPGTLLDDVSLTAGLIGYGTESRPLTLLGRDSAAAEFRLSSAALGLNELVVAGAQSPTAEAAADAPRAATRQDAASVVWRAASRAAAEAEAGFRILTIPEREVTGVSVATVGDDAFVRVVQGLEGGSTVELVEGRSPIPPALASAPEGQARVTLRQGTLYLSATAPMSREALEELIQSVR